MTQYKDKKGITIEAGDLLRTLHFIGARRKRHYLYHVAVAAGDTLVAVPTCHLEPTKVSGGGKAPVSSLLQEWGGDTQIISGSGLQERIA